MQYKILVVDDEADVNDMLALNLRGAGFQVVAVTDGAAALAKARSEAPNLIILDLMLPQMSGLEVCKVLKSEAGTRHIQSSCSPRRRRRSTRSWVSSSVRTIT